MQLERLAGFVAGVDDAALFIVEFLHAVFEGCQFLLAWLNFGCRIRDMIEDRLGKDKTSFAFRSVILVLDLDACDFKGPGVEVGSLFEGLLFLLEY